MKRTDHSAGPSGNRALPKILIDARMVGPVPHGFSRYVERMAEGLQELGQLDYEPIFIVNESFSERTFKGFGTVAAKSPFLSGAELLELPWLLAREKAALYHSPSFSSLLAAPCPWVVTVHDLNHLSFGDAKRRLYYRVVLRTFIRLSRKLITVSRFSAGELSEWLGIDSGRIALVFNSLEREFLAEVRSGELDEILGRFSLRRGEYFFCLSNLKPHKNLARLFEAYRDYRGLASHPPGAPGESAGPWPLVLNLKPDHPPEGVLSLGALTDAEVRALLAGSGAAVFPSLYEGFGLPPVEAAVLGAPLLVSNIPAHREGLAVLEEREACWVEPEDIPAWTAALLRASRSELTAVSAASRAELRRRYSTERMGQDMDRIYRDVLDLD